jgi:hypothetical protein
MKKITNKRTNGNVSLVRKAYENSPTFELGGRDLKRYFFANPNRSLIDEAIALRDQYAILGNSNEECNESAYRIRDMLNSVILNQLEICEELKTGKKSEINDLDFFASRREMYEDVDFAKKIKKNIWKE